MLEGESPLVCIILTEADMSQQCASRIIMHIWEVVRSILEESERRERLLRSAPTALIINGFARYLTVQLSLEQFLSIFLSSPIERASGYNQIMELSAQNESFIEKQTLKHVGLHKNILKCM